jgi:hypothetical protein
MIAFYWGAPMVVEKSHHVYFYGFSFWRKENNEHKFGIGIIVDTRNPFRGY